MLINASLSSFFFGVIIFQDFAAPSLQNSVADSIYRPVVLANGKHSITPLLYT